MRAEYLLPESIVRVPSHIVASTQRFHEAYAQHGEPPPGSTPPAIQSAEIARIRYLHDLERHLDSREQWLGAACCLVTIGREVEPAEPSKRVRNQARIVLAQKILEAGRVAWPRDAEDEDAIAVLHLLVDFYAAHPEHNRGTSTRNEKAVWKFLEACWANYRGVSGTCTMGNLPMISRALIVSRGFDVLRRNRITMATSELYGAILGWLHGVDRCGREHPAYNSARPDWVETIMVLCGCALRVEQPGFGIDNAGLHDAARTLLEFTALLISGSVAELEAQYARATAKP